MVADGYHASLVYRRSARRYLSGTAPLSAGPRCGGPRKTTDRRTANQQIAVASAELERESARLAAEAKRGNTETWPGVGFCP